MSKITNDGLTRPGIGCFIAVPCGTTGRQRVKANQKQHKVNNCDFIVKVLGVFMSAEERQLQSDQPM